MRRLVWIFAVMAVLWYGLWMLATSAIETGMQGWLEDRRAEGWQAEIAATTTSGFPSRLEMAMNGIELADPTKGVAIKADNLRLSAKSYWPGDVTMTLPATPVILQTPDISLSLLAKHANADMRLHPSLSLQLEQLSASSGAWQLNAPAGPILSAVDFNAEVTQRHPPETYHFSLNANQLTPGIIVRDAILLPTDWPLAFETFVADLTITFDAPLDRHALENRHPQPRQVQVDTVEINWGGVGLSAQGDLKIDATGIPTGQLDLVIRDWRAVFDLVAKNGALSEHFRPQAELMLNALSNMNDDPNTLNLGMGFRNGSVFLGPIPLGPAPRLILR